MILTLEVAGFDEACDIAQDILDNAGAEIRDTLSNLGMTAQITMTGDGMVESY